MALPAQLTTATNPLLSQAPSPPPRKVPATQQVHHSREGLHNTNQSADSQGVRQSPSVPGLPMLLPGPVDDGGDALASTGHPAVLTPPVTPTQPDCFGVGFNLQKSLGVSLIATTPTGESRAPSHLPGPPCGSLGRGAADPGATPKVRRRARMQYSPQQLMVLEDAFVKNIYPTREDRHILEALTGLNVERIKIWFQNRRSREKKRERLSQAGLASRSSNSYLLACDIHRGHTYAAMLSAREDYDKDGGSYKDTADCVDLRAAGIPGRPGVTDVSMADTLMKFCPSVRAVPCSPLVPSGWPYCSLYPGSSLLHPHLPPTPVFPPPVASLYDFCRFSVPSSVCGGAGSPVSRFPPWQPSGSLSRPWHPTSTMSCCGDKGVQGGIPISPPASPAITEVPSPSSSYDKPIATNQHRPKEDLGEERVHHDNASEVKPSECPTLRDLLNKPFMSWPDAVSAGHNPGTINTCPFPRQYPCWQDHGALDSSVASTGSLPRQYPCWQDHGAVDRSVAPAGSLKSRDWRSRQVSDQTSSPKREDSETSEPPSQFAKFI